ncbi:hypothetical protein NtB2_01045 [Lactococcus termiticola]|uniref:Uncharacterized protein n=2 Tax=Lactococcus termiticola TaxID=2169526 RepID=A0A2R5HJS4_9LACT|nr:hypothetical protein NtB2_01045 [Lactococcus termiticola]
MKERKLRVVPEGDGVLVKLFINKFIAFIGIIFSFIGALSILFYLPEILSGSFYLPLGGSRYWGMIGIDVHNKPLAWLVGFPFYTLIMFVLFFAAIYLILLLLKRPGILINAQGITKRRIRKSKLIAWKNISDIELKYGNSIYLKHNRGRSDVLKLRGRYEKRAKEEHLQLFNLLNHYFEKYKKKEKT